MWQLIGRQRWPWGWYSIYLIVTHSNTNLIYNRVTLQSRTEWECELRGDFGWLETNLENYSHGEWQRIKQWVQWCSGAKPTNCGRDLCIQSCKSSAHASPSTGNANRKWEARIGMHVERRLTVRLRRTPRPQSTRIFMQQESGTLHV